jgi:alanine dehydrogenase
MIIGVAKEIKNNEYRVALTPAGCQTLTQLGHQVLIENEAGIGSGFSNEEYVQAGGTIVDNDTIFNDSKLILKVKEPLHSEYTRLKSDQTIFTYLHLAANKELTLALIESKCTAIAYESITKDGTLPLLTPMSEIAGRMSIQQGAKFLEKPNGGSGVLLGGVPGVKPGHVLVLGGGVVGTQAAKMAAGLGARVTIMDVNLNRLRTLSDILANVTTEFSSEWNIRQILPTVDLVIGAVLIPGMKAPTLVTKDMLKLMKPGSVIVDVAVDQGGCIETCEVTTHENPVKVKEGIIHYGVANMPGAVPRTSTIALTQATLPYILKIVKTNDPLKDNDLKNGVDVMNGNLLNQQVAKSLGLNEVQS